jgi:hypothetical protein
MANQPISMQRIKQIIRYHHEGMAIKRIVKLTRTIILPESWTRGLVKKSLNLTKQYDQTNPTQIHA